MQLILTYDINVFNGNYKEMKNFVKENGFTQLTESTYLINSFDSINELDSKVKNFVTKDDKVYIINANKDQQLNIHKVN